MGFIDLSATPTTSSTLQSVVGCEFDGEAAVGGNLAGAVVSDGNE